MTTIVSGAATDPGLQRSTNEDRIYADGERGVFLVVDGLGGHAAGEMAAQVAVDVIAREFTVKAENTRNQVRRAIALANNEIFRRARENADCAGMGCVLTLAVIRDGAVTVGHVGDSRLYLIWNGCVRKLTSDHSPVGEQEDMGEMTEFEAMAHPRRNEVFRDLGSREHSIDDVDFAEVKSFRLHDSAALLLCTDGLSDVLMSAEIGEIVDTFDGDANAVARALICAAKNAGGTDNISVVFVPGPDFIGAQSPAAAAARARHAITRMRRPQSRWMRRFRRSAWVVLGMVLGIILWLGVQKLMGVVG
jgi:serine/threonine protein phosphatase PrpC